MCSMSKYLAYAMSVYCLASIYYMLRTITVGTPFNDSLTYEQVKIKKASAKVRRNIFLQGIVGGFILIFLLQPFKKC